MESLWVYEPHDRVGPMPSCSWPTQNEFNGVFEKKKKKASFLKIKDETQNKLKTERAITIRMEHTLNLTIFQ